MPLFRRSDGVLVRDLAPVRRIMPYLMRGRNESVVLHEQICEVARARARLEAWNRARPDRPHGTLFHLFLWSCARALHERPGLNRFVSGGRIYQRHGVQISFAAKRSFDEHAPLVTIKLPMPEGEPFGDLVERATRSIGDGRRGAGADGRERDVDKEVRLLVKLPHPLIRLGVWLFRTLDRWNLAPRRMIEHDPMYASLFVANIGSVGLDNVYHHLYEYGTIPLFGVMGAVRGDRVQVRWTFDERVNDGFTCMLALKRLQELFEDPPLE